VAVVSLLLSCRPSQQFDTTLVSFHTIFAPLSDIQLPLTTRSRVPPSLRTATGNMRLPIWTAAIAAGAMIATTAFTPGFVPAATSVGGGRRAGPPSSSPSSSSSSPSSGWSTSIRASSDESESFQRRLLATRLALEKNAADDDEDASTSAPNTVLLEDADGLGVALTSSSTAAGAAGGGESLEGAAPAVEGAAATASTVVELMNGTLMDDDDMAQLLADLEEEAEKLTQEMVDEECVIDQDTGGPTDELCADERKMRGFRQTVKSTIGATLKMVRGMPKEVLEGDVDVDDGSLAVLGKGDLLEQGWTQRGDVSALRRNAEVWKFALKCVFRALKPRSMRKKGASEKDIQKAQIEAATFIRDGLLTLGPTFVKLGQVVSTRTDVLPATYTDVLKSLQNEVPGFSGSRAKKIVSEELGKPADEIFTDFSEQPVKAASLGQVHTAYYKGQKVAIKVQRAGLKELFDVDLKNLKKLAVLLDKFDPKSDGADRDWVSIYEESERLLYLEIDYLNEAANCERFAKDFRDVDYVRVPRVYRELSTPRVLTMEFIESIKLTDIKRIDELGLDRQVLAKRTADAFLRQIVETSYFRKHPASFFFFS
jgi:hypothetical protein